MELSSGIFALLGVALTFVLEELRFHLRRKAERHPSVSIDRRHERESMSDETFVVVTNTGERTATVIDVRFSDGSGFRGFSSFTLQPNACREFSMRDSLGSGRVSVVLSGGIVFRES